LPQPEQSLKAKVTGLKFAGHARIAAMLRGKSSSNDVNLLKVNSDNRQESSHLLDEEEQERCRRHVGQNHRECLNGCSGGGPEPDCKVCFFRLFKLLVYVFLDPMRAKTSRGDAKMSDA